MSKTEPIGRRVKIHSTTGTLQYLGVWGNNGNAWVIALVERSDGTVTECLAKNLTFIKEKDHG